MDSNYLWEAVRANGSVARGIATTPEEAGLYRMPDDLDFLCVIHKPLPPDDFECEDEVSTSSDRVVSWFERPIRRANKS